MYLYKSSSRLPAVCGNVGIADKNRATSGWGKRCTYPLLSERLGGGSLCPKFPRSIQVPNEATRLQAPLDTSRSARLSGR